MCFPACRDLPRNQSGKRLVNLLLVPAVAYASNEKVGAEPDEQSILFAPLHKF